MNIFDDLVEVFGHDVSHKPLSIQGVVDGYGGLGESGVGELSVLHEVVVRKSPVVQTATERE